MMRTTFSKRVTILFGKFSTVIFNKYLLAFTLFVVWLSFFDKNAILTQWKLSQTIDELERERTFISEEIERTKLVRENLSENQEKYAREKFYMKKPGEQVFIIE